MHWIIQCVGELFILTRDFSIHPWLGTTCDHSNVSVLTANKHLWAAQADEATMNRFLLMSYKAKGVSRPLIGQFVLHLASDWPSVVTLECRAWYLIPLDRFTRTLTHLTSDWSLRVILASDWSDYVTPTPLIRHLTMSEAIETNFCYLVLSSFCCKNRVYTRQEDLNIYFK